MSDWEDGCTATGCAYLNSAAFVRVPTSSVTNATLRPGTYMVGMARGPNRLEQNLTIAKSFGLGEGRRVQFRADIFNLLNAKNYNNPQQAINNVDFTRITGAARGTRVPARREDDLLKGQGVRGKGQTFPLPLSSLSARLSETKSDIRYGPNVCTLDLFVNTCNTGG